MAGHRQRQAPGAGSGNRTRILSLEGCCTTTVLYPPAGDRRLTYGADAGSAGRIRTYDQSVNSRLLYR